MAGRKRKGLTSRIKLIAEIQGLMEDHGKTKDWILEELKKHRIPLKVSPTANSYEILYSISDKMIVHIHKFLKYNI